MAWLNDWVKRVKLTIDKDDVDATLSNFPVLVYLSSSSGIGSKDLTAIFDEVGANSKKIAVTSSDGETQLYVEIERWDNGNEVAWLWVKAPSVSHTEDTVLYLYYDNSKDDNTDYVGDPNSAAAEAVWDANFEIVTHMQDDPDNEHVRDSTDHDDDGTKFAAGEPEEVAGKIDKGQDFDGTGDYISFSTVDVQGEHTIELWLNPDSIGPLDVFAYFRTGNSLDALSVCVLGTGKLLACARGISAKSRMSTITIDADWHHIVITKTTLDIQKIYIDGVDRTEAATTALSIGAVDHRVVGCNWAAANPSHHFAGLMDEVRLSSVQRNASYVKANYETQRDHLVTYGSEEFLAIKTLQKIEIDGVVVTGDCLSSIVSRRENAIADALILANDLEGETFLNKANVGDLVKISYVLEGENSWTQVFEGDVVELNPELNITGEMCIIRCYGVGIALKRMRVKGEYGSESENDSLDTVREILNDATIGILPKYVNKIMGGAVDSGYNISGTYIDTDATVFEYLMWKCPPITAAIKDMCNLITASKWDEEDKEGVHWQIIPHEGSYYLCLGTIGKHDEATPNAFDSLWANNYAGGTLTVGTNILSSWFTKLSPEANYVLVYGKYQKPIEDEWTELSAAQYTKNEKIVALTDDEDHKVGSYSIKAQPEAYYTGVFYYSGEGALGLDIYDISSESHKASIAFYAKLTGGVNGQIRAFNRKMTVRLYTGTPVNGSHFFEKRLDLIFKDDEWYYIELPLGPWCTENEGWETHGSPDWHQIDYVGFSIYGGTLAGSGTVRMYLDGLEMVKGLVARAAYHSGNITEHGCIIKLVKDSLAKSDNLVADDDDGVLAQLAKAELLRCMTTPIVGQITIELDPAAMAGQLVTVVNPRNTNFGASGTLQMRILEVKHEFQLSGQVTRLKVTSDLKNSYPIQPANAYNAILKAVKPDSQDRTRADLVAQDIDIDIKILEKDYA